LSQIAQLFVVLFVWNKTGNVLITYHYGAFGDLPVFLPGLPVMKNASLPRKFHQVIRNWH